MNAPAAYDLSPLGAVALVGGLLALGPLLWVWLRQGKAVTGDRGARRLQALTVVTLFLTFDLVLFGAFTGSPTPAWAAPTGPVVTAVPARSARRPTFKARKVCCRAGRSRMAKPGSK